MVIAGEVLGNRLRVMDQSFTSYLAREGEPVVTLSPPPFLNYVNLFGTSAPVDLPGNWVFLRMRM